MMTLAPSMLQCMPECSRFALITFLHSASSTLELTQSALFAMSRSALGADCDRNITCFLVLVHCMKYAPSRPRGWMHQSDRFRILTVLANIPKMLCCVEQIHDLYRFGESAPGRSSKFTSLRSQSPLGVRRFRNRESEFGAGISTTFFAVTLEFMRNFLKINQSRKQQPTACCYYYPSLPNQHSLGSVPHSCPSY